MYGRLAPVGDAECIARAIITTFEGEVIRPPLESWQPYELDTVVSQYLNAVGSE
jgi:hypothetical protein